MSSMRQTGINLTALLQGEVNRLDTNPRNLSDMSQWSEELVSRFAAAVRSRRRALGISAQELADRTAALGHPVTRSAIAAWENNARGDRLMIGDAMILAEALNIPIGALLFPRLADGMVEAAPGWEIPSVEALLRLAGIDEGADTPWQGRDDEYDIDSFDERESGFLLASNSQWLRNLRIELEGLEEDLADSLRGDIGPEGGKYDLPINTIRSLISLTRAQIREKEALVLELGGVVDNG